MENGIGIHGTVEKSIISNSINGDDDLALQGGLLPQNSEFQKVHSLLVDGGDRFGVSTITVDLQEELIWMGNQGGHVTSYYGNNMEKYTSFQVHPTQEIRQILTFDDLILILSQSQLRGQVRRGLPVFTHTSENMQEMQCMLQTSPTTILMGGLQQELVEFDLTTSTQTKTVQLSDSGCAILRSQGRLVCTGEPTGQIHLLDSRTFRKEQTLEAHSGSLSDFDVHGNLMVTCGFSTRHGNLSVDRFLKVYDIRILRALAPIPVSVDPFLLRFLPSFSSRIATLSPGGQMEILETQAVSQANICLYQVTSNASMCLSFDVSSSCHHLAFGDSSGSLHLFSSNPTAMFNSFSRDTEFPDPVETFPPINFNDELASFSTIPLPFSTTSSLLSDWPLQYCSPVYRRVPPIEPSILQSIKTVGTIGYAPNPGTFRRNQMQYNSSLSSSGSLNNLNNNFFNKSSVSPSNSSNNVNINNNNTHHHHHPQEGPGSSPTHTSPHKHNGHMGGLNAHNPFASPQHPSSGPNPNGSHNTSPINNMKHHSHHNNHPPPYPHHMPMLQYHNMPPNPPTHRPTFFPGMPPSGLPSPGMMPPGPGGPGSGPRPFFHKPTAFMKNTFYPGKRSAFHTSRYQLPKRYTKYEWKKNFFEESDMESFNRTKFSGLEATQANAYSNSMLQVLYHIDYLRIGLISHLCDKEACLSCELGFLFHMLDKTKVVPCVASNFLRAFRLVPEASALGLILQESQSKQRGAFLRLIQSFNRFILHQIETETGKSSDGESPDRTDPISQLFAIKQENLNRCTRCGREEKKESTVLLSNLLYSPDASGGGKRCRFIDLLQRSLCPEQTTPAWCEKCGKYQATFQSRVPKALPSFISLNTCLDNAHDFQLWRNHLESLLPDKGGKVDMEVPGTPPMAMNPIGMGHKGPPPHLKSCRYGRNCMRPDCKFWHEGRGLPNKPEHVKMTEFEVNPEVQVKWLPTSIRVSIEDRRRVVCVDLDLNESLARQEIPPEAIQEGSAGDYELMSVICFVRDSDSEERNNLVSLIHVDSTYYQRAGQSEVKSKWFIFNDFCVREVPVAEAFSFNPKWKIPCVIYYRKKQAHMPAEVQNPPPILPTVTIDVFTNPEEGKDGKSRKVTYKPLDLEEIPVKDELVAMDAEFVTLGQEETELRSDGKLATVKPQQMTVARVTCIRGQGDLEGTPFLDDYISTQEVVVDYLTKFSGIKPGDLDVNFSSKNITMLKTVYLKLRFLIDSGVKFVGHGLNNDFRVINLIVPPEQIIDTVSLFYLPNQRMISLRFLAWHFLRIVIQSEVHDSTEDARTALQLYRKYEELKSSGKLEKALEELYEAGKKVQWKVPSEPTATASK